MGRLARAKKCERAIQNTEARTDGQDAAVETVSGKIRTESIPLSKLNPSPYNPRKDLKPNDPEYIAIKRSITEFGLVENLVWNKRTGNLVGGHQRLKVLKELGYEAADVAVVDLPVKQEKILNIILNKAQGEWDIPKLKDILVELDDGEFDLEITGFSEPELESLINYDKPIDPRKEWEGMPEFMQGDVSGRRLIVHFKSDEDIKAFAKLVNQKITDDTKFIWFPALEREIVADKRYVSES